MSVAILQPGHINLGEVAEGDLDEASGITGGGDTVGRTGRDPELLADGGVPRIPIAPDPADQTPNPTLVAKGGWSGGGRRLK